MTDSAIIFTPDGQGRCLHTEAIDLAAIGQLHIERATTIEFDNKKQYWRVRDPVGCALFNSPSRQACLDWERLYLQQQEELKHESITVVQPASVVLGNAWSAGELADGRSSCVPRRRTSVTMPQPPLKALPAPGTRRPHLSESVLNQAR